MAVPKRKKSHSRTRMRRTRYWEVKLPTLVKCESCGAYILPHHACPYCGYYRTRKYEIVLPAQIRKKEKKEESK